MDHFPIYPKEHKAVYIEILPIYFPKYTIYSKEYKAVYIEILSQYIFKSCQYWNIAHVFPKIYLRFQHIETMSIIKTHPLSPIRPQLELTCKFPSEYFNIYLAVVWSNLQIFFMSFFLGNGQKWPKKWTKWQNMA